MTINEYIEILKKDNSIILIDVRTPEEYSEGNISQSVNIPLSNIKNIEEVYPDKNKKYFVHCKSGNRAENAKRIMNMLGYKDVTNIGGYDNYVFKEL